METANRGRAAPPSGCALPLDRSGAEYRARLQPANASTPPRVACFGLTPFPRPPSNRELQRADPTTQMETANGGWAAPPSGCALSLDRSSAEYRARLQPANASTPPRVACFGLTPSA